MDDFFLPQFVLFSIFRSLVTGFTKSKYQFTVVSGIFVDKLKLANSTSTKVP
jgi:hypothetical protein